MCSKNKDTDQLHSYCQADLPLCFRICKMLVFSCGGSFHFKAFFLCLYDETAIFAIRKLGLFRNVKKLLDECFKCYMLGYIRSCLTVEKYIQIN